MRSDPILGKARVEKQCSARDISSLKLSGSRLNISPNSTCSTWYVYVYFTPCHPSVLVFTCILYAKTKPWTYDGKNMYKWLADCLMLKVGRREEVEWERPMWRRGYRQAGSALEKAGLCTYTQLYQGYRLLQAIGISQRPW